MTLLEAIAIIAVIQTGVMMVGGFYAWSSRRDARALDKEISDVKSQLGGLSWQRLYGAFVTTDRWQDLLRESHDDHAAIWREIERIRDRKG